MTPWSILPAYLIRVAGFAFDRLEPLRCLRAPAAEEVLAGVADARTAAGRAFDDALDQERYATNPAFDDAAARKVLARCVKQVRAFARRLSDEPPPAEALREVVRVVPRVAAQADELDQAHARWRDAAHAYDHAFADDLAQARDALRRLYQDERLQEAVFVESPEAYEAIQPLIASLEPRHRTARRRDRVAAMYAQRFCAKNDTNSICGPIGVGNLAAADAGGAARIEIEDPDARRETYFSHWAAQCLLDEAVRRAGDAVRITLRLHPAARIEDGCVAWCAMHEDGATLRRRYARSELPVAGARLLRALVRPRTPAELAGLAGELGLSDGELAAFVAQLVDAGLVLRGPMLPPGLFRPLRAVAAEVERWPASDARTWALAEIAALEELLAAFGRAPLSGRVELHRRLAARFEAATGRPAARGAGRHYADRSLFHEDCYAEIRSDLGTARASLDDALPALIAAAGLPLELARERTRTWFRARFGAGARVPVLEAHRAFDGDRVFDPAATTPRTAALRSAIERVQGAIARAVAASGGGPARLSAHELRLALAEVAVPARSGYVNADVMLRRLPSGGTELVLAELHGFIWIPTCSLDILPPDLREQVVDLMRAAVRDMARGRTTAECVFTHSQATDRRVPLASVDLQMLVPSDRPGALDIGGLDVRLAGDDFEFLHGEEEIIPLVPYTRYPFLLCTSRVAPLYDDFTERFFPDSLLPAALRDRDAPRLAVDDLVFRRRLWQRPATAVRAALAADSEAELFRRAQALRRELGCDARVFVSLSGQPKPVLLDFHNVFLLEALVRLLAREPDDAPVKLSEMLPGPDELVARGPDGVRTSELRMGFYRVCQDAGAAAR